MQHDNLAVMLAFHKKIAGKENNYYHYSLLLVEQCRTFYVLYCVITLLSFCVTCFSLVMGLRCGPRRTLSLLFACAWLVAGVCALDNGLAKTPPMGWLAWERFRCNTDCKNDPDNCIRYHIFF